MASILRPSAKAVVLNDGGLLVIRNQSDQDSEGEWLALPGGGQRPLETLHQALVREVAEETGMEVRPGRLLWVREYIPAHHEFAHMGEEDHAIDFMFEVEALGDAGLPTEPDSHQIGWEWVMPANLRDRRFFPAALIDPITAYTNSAAPGPVYLGDVN